MPDVDQLPDRFCRGCGVGRGCHAPPRAAHVRARGGRGPRVVRRRIRDAGNPVSAPASPGRRHGPAVVAGRPAGIPRAATSGRRTADLARADASFDDDRDAGGCALRGGGRRRHGRPRAGAHAGAARRVETDGGAPRRRPWRAVDGRPGAAIARQRCRGRERVADRARRSGAASRAHARGASTPDAGADRSRRELPGGGDRPRRPSRARPAGVAPRGGKTPGDGPRHRITVCADRPHWLESRGSRRRRGGRRGIRPPTRVHRHRQDAGPVAVGDPARAAPRVLRRPRPRRTPADSIRAVLSRPADGAVRSGRKRRVARGTGVELVAAGAAACRARVAVARRDWRSGARQRPGARPSSRHRPHLPCREARSPSRGTQRPR